MPTKKRNQPVLITDLRPVVKRPSRSQRIKRLVKKNQQLLIIILALLVVVVAIYWAVTQQHAGSGQNNLNDVVSKVGKLILLPKDENPTLATVEDKTKLKDKFLAANAENGDRVLIYAKNHLVIIYRPSINKIAAVGAVSSDPALAEARGATLTVLNGDNDAAKTQLIIDKIKAAYPDIKIINGGDSNRKDFPYTIVIDNTNQKDNLLLKLVNVVSGKRGIQPPTEVRATTDFLIIVGKD